MTDHLPHDALADVLGDIAAEIEKDWRRDYDRMAAEARASIAEAQVKFVELGSALKSLADEQIARVSAAIAGIKNGEPGRDGRDADPVDMTVIERTISEMVTHGIAAISAALPVPKDGRDGIDGKDAEPITDADIAAAVLRYFEVNPVKAGEPGAPGAPGRDAEPVSDEQIAAAVETILPDMLDDVAARYLAANPPKDGVDGDPGPAGKDAEPVDYENIHKFIVERIAEIPTPKDGVDGRDGKDGVGLTGGLIDRSGALVLTLSDGTVRDLGRVVGKDADVTLIAGMIREEVAKIPPPRDGRDGSDGKDGIGFDDLEFEHDGERKFALKFVRGEHVERFEFSVPSLIYRDVWREGHYERGDVVTFGGSAFIAQRNTTEKPDSASKDWRLMAKKGRDGKDGVMRQIPSPGPVKIG